MTNEPLTFLDTLYNMVSIVEALMLSPLVIFLLTVGFILLLARKAF